MILIRLVSFSVSFSPPNPHTSLYALYTHTKITATNNKELYNCCSLYTSAPKSTLQAHSAHNTVPGCNWAYLSPPCHVSYAYCRALYGWQFVTLSGCMSSSLEEILHHIGLLLGLPVSVSYHMSLFVLSASRLDSLGFSA